MGLKTKLLRRMYKPACERRSSGTGPRFLRRSSSHLVLVSFERLWWGWFWKLLDSLQSVFGCCHGKKVLLDVTHRNYKQAESQQERSNFLTKSYALIVESYIELAKNKQKCSYSTKEQSKRMDSWLKKETYWQVYIKKWGIHM